MHNYVMPGSLQSLRIFDGRLLILIDSTGPQTLALTTAVFNPASLPWGLASAMFPDYILLDKLRHEDYMFV